MSIEMAGPIAYLSDSGSAVFFSKGSAGAGTSKTMKGQEGTALPIRKLQNELDVAFWGEDNRFPQNIEQQMAYCGIGKAGLDWKMRFLWGNGIVPGKVTGQNDDGSDIFTPLNRADSGSKAVYKFLGDRRMFRFWLEYGQDWTWFVNCFPEMVFTKDGKSVSHFVHQESCDSRYKQMNDDGVIDTVYLSKLWGASGDQYAKFDPKRVVKGLLRNPESVDLIDHKFIKKLDCIDMYNPVASAKEIADKLNQTRKPSELKSAIFPVNYPSVNKTYYQVPAWDGARLAGWVEIASKIPSLLKTLYNKAFRLRYHIEVPENYFPKKFGPEVWKEMDEAKQTKARKDLLEDMDKFLSGDENAFKSFISFFEIATHDKTEYARIKITPVEDKSNLDKEMVTQSQADTQILASMNVQPDLLGAGSIGTGKQMSGGTKDREALLIYLASLKLEREIFLEPLYLKRDFDGWDSDIEFRHRDTILTTLDTGAGTKKVLS